MLKLLYLPNYNRYLPKRKKVPRRFVKIFFFLNLINVTRSSEVVKMNQNVFFFLILPQIYYIKFNHYVKTKSLFKGTVQYFRCPVRYSYKMQSCSFKNRQNLNLSSSLDTFEPSFFVRLVALRANRLLFLPTELFKQKYFCRKVDFVKYVCVWSIRSLLH